MRNPLTGQLQMTMEFKFDVGDNVYYIRNDKVAYAKVIHIDLHKETLADGTIHTKVDYRVRDNGDAQTTTRNERSLGHTQAELFAGLKMTGPEHDDVEKDLWREYSKLGEV